MAINKIDFKCYHEFKVDETELLYTRDDGQIATCHSAATLATELGVAQFNLIQRIQFLWLDFCALIPFFRAAQFDTLKIDIMPALLRKIAEMNQFVRENYDCAGKNVDCLSDAKVVCLGETHIHNAHRKNNGKLIDELIGNSNSDILLDERPFFDKDGKPWLPNETFSATVHDRSEQTAFVKKPVVTWGWDCRDRKAVQALNQESKHLANSLFLLTSYSLISKYILQNELNNSWVFWGLCGLVSFKWITANFALLRLTKEAVYETFLSSNQHMCKAIDHFLHHRKVYVIAGSAHLGSDKGIEFTQGVAELNECLKNKKHMILIPKTSFNLRTLFERITAHPVFR